MERLHPVGKLYVVVAGEQQTSAIMLLHPAIEPPGHEPFGLPGLVGEPGQQGLQAAPSLHLYLPQGDLRLVFADETDRRVADVHSGVVEQALVDMPDLLDVQSPVAEPLRLRGTCAAALAA
jgi:hypothetical protein